MLGCVVLVIANVAVFARTLVFDTDTFADVVAPEQPDEEVIAGVADTLSDKIVTATAVQDRIAHRLSDAIEAAKPTANGHVAGTEGGPADG